MNTHTHIHAISENETMNLKESREGGVNGGLWREVKERRNVIIILQPQKSH